MKKLVTIILVALVAISCVFALAACGKTYDNTILADQDGYSYVITGAFNGWGVKTITPAEGNPVLDAQYQMWAISLNDPIVASIAKDLESAGVKALYAAQHTFTNNKNGDEWEAGWSIKYVTKKGADPIELDGNMAIKVIKTKWETLGDTAAWSQAWLPDAGGTTFKSLTPSTLYMPPHSEAELWEGSGAWNDNPVVLEAGSYYVVLAVFADGTFGLGAIAR